MTEADLRAEGTPDLDILIVGAGPVGMTLAAALAKTPLRIQLVDRQAPGAWRSDPRALALSHGSRQLLERLGAWNNATATPIHDIHVSQRGGFGRTRLCATDYGLPALGYVQRYGDLLDALHARLPEAQLSAPVRLRALRENKEYVAATLDDNGLERTITARMIVHAEGTPQDDPAIWRRDYHQHAIVCEVHTAEPHAQRAWERFTPDGPLALLPLRTGYAVVFTVAPARAKELLALEDADFLAALRHQFGERLIFTDVGPRAAFPLALRLRKHLTAGRQLWLGNTAQTLHPVSGQGFNLGLRDAWELANTLLDADAGDPGLPGPLATYARGRQLDRYGSALFTDGIVTLFSNDLPPLRALRGLGLAALDLIPPLRHFVARRMIWGAR